MKKYFFALLLFLTINFTSAHPYYVSVIEVKISSSKKEVQISCRMFTDDLQEALYKLYGHRQNLQTNGIASNDDILSKYLSQKIKLKISNIPIKLNYLGYENEEEAVWVYLEAQNLKIDSKIVELDVSILYDFLKTQTNLIHCYFDSQRISYKLDNPTSKTIFNFK